VADVDVEVELFPHELTVEVVQGTVSEVSFTTPGPAGRDGIDGVDGRDGIDGRDGVDGVDAEFDLAQISYTHVQSASASVWVIVHNLGFIPSVSVFDSAGSQLEADLSFPDSNTVVVSLSIPLSGTAHLS
jgi:hypothetical protein